MPCVPDCSQTQDEMDEVVLLIWGRSIRLARLSAQAPRASIHATHQARTLPQQHLLPSPALLFLEKLVIALLVTFDLRA